MLVFNLSVGLGGVPNLGFWIVSFTHFVGLLVYYCLERTSGILL